MLHLEGLEASYGKNQVLFGTGLTVHQGEAVALMGRNGMGKTTTVHCIVGLVQPWNGTMTFESRKLNGMAPHQIARLGIGVVPEGRHVFPTLTVEENLIATAANYGGLPKPWTRERVYELFPQLKAHTKRLAGTLSGGEQQMLAIGRALMLSPKLLILDEATEGLAPLIRDEIWNCLRSLKDLGNSILVIDKNIGELALIADRAYVMEKGAIVWCGAAKELVANVHLQTAYLGL
jgi:branched-chain amino acid transport system ATP-binding protein